MTVAIGTLLISTEAQWRACVEVVEGNLLYGVATCNQRSEAYDRKGGAYDPARRSL